MDRIRLKTEQFSFFADLYSTPTAKTIKEKLPLEGRISTWGGEIYFTTEIRLELEGDAREIVEAGDLAFWPDGSAFCVFFGKTPASTTDKPQAYSKVNIFGKIQGPLETLYQIRNGEKILITLSS